jgi:hypothetical protein
MERESEIRKGDGGRRLRHFRIGRISERKRCDQTRGKTFRETRTGRVKIRVEFRAAADRGTKEEESAPLTPNSISDVCRLLLILTVTVTTFVDRHPFECPSIRI